MIRNCKWAALILPLVLTLLALGGCGKGWLDVNYTPKELSDHSATPDLTTAPLLENAAAVQNSEFDILSMWMGYWCPPHASPGQAITTYNNLSMGGSGGPTAEILYTEQKALSLGQDFYAGIAKVLKTLAWAQAVDKENNMPYSEAFQTAILQPKYDQGQFIYEDLMKELTTASGLIRNADIAKNTKIAVVDIIYHGNKTKWLKFINTIKLRLLVHQANRPDRASYIAKEIQVISAEGSGFLTDEADVNPGYGIDTQLSPYFRLFSGNNRFIGGSRNSMDGANSIDIAHANIFALNLLKANKDPRIDLFYTRTDSILPPGAPEPFVQPGPIYYRGSQFGLPIRVEQFPFQENVYLSGIGGNKNTEAVNPAASGLIKGNNMDGWVMTSVESYFLQAEAVYRGWIPGDPEQSYKAAVQQSFRWLNAGGNTNIPQLSDNIFKDWYDTAVKTGNVNVSWAAASDKYKLIMFQKYVALNGIDPLETWTDYRRNGRYPDLPVSADPARRGNTLPIRLVYPSSEYQLNPKNVAAQGDINMFTSKIWWMP